MRTLLVKRVTRRACASISNGGARVFGMLEEVVQRGIMPRNAVRVGQFLQPLDVPFGDGAARFLIVRIAVVHTTTERPRLTGRAKVLLLKGTKVGRDGVSVIVRSGAQQHLRFEIAEEERVAVFLEATAAAAGDARRPGRGDLTVHVP